MPSQFLHLSVFGRSPVRGARRHETAAGILAEAARLPGTHPHVPAPLWPTVLHGVSPEKVLPRIGALARQARDRRGRRLRRDAALLLSIVASYPISCSELAASDEANAQYVAWRQATLDWLRGRWGERLESVVEHRDEPFPHLHAHVVPACDSAGCILWHEVHPGRAAEQGRRNAGGSPRECREAYRAAMGELLDEFYDTVSEPFGHGRIGPARPRRTRADHLLVRRLEHEKGALELELARARLALESAQYYLSAPSGPSGAGLQEQSQPVINRTAVVGEIAADWPSSDPLPTIEGAESDCKILASDDIRPDDFDADSDDGSDDVGPDDFGAEDVDFDTDWESSFGDVPPTIFNPRISSDDARRFGVVPDPRAASP